MIILSRIMMSLIGDIDLLIILINYALLVLVVSLLFSTEFSFFLLGSSRENQTKKKKNNKGRNGNKNKNAPKRKKQNQTILNFSPTNLDSIHLLLMTILYVGRINHSILHFFVLFCFFFFILPRTILFTNDGIVPVDPILSDT